MHVDVQKDLLDFAPFQVDDKRRCHGSRTQKQATGLQPRCSKQTTDFWEYSPSMNTYDSAHPKLIKWSKIKNQKKTNFLWSWTHLKSLPFFWVQKATDDGLRHWAIFWAPENLGWELSVRSLGHSTSIGVFFGLRCGTKTRQGHLRSPVKWRTFWK